MFLWKLVIYNNRKRIIFFSVNVPDISWDLHGTKIVCWLSENQSEQDCPVFYLVYLLGSEKDRQ
jgi:hypothetical protein